MLTFLWRDRVRLKPVQPADRRGASCGRYAISSEVSLMYGGALFFPMFGAPPRACPTTLVNRFPDEHKRHIAACNSVIA